MKIKGLKLGNITIFKTKSIERYLHEIGLIIQSKREQIELGYETIMDIIDRAEDRIKSIEKGMIKSMQEQF